MYVIASNGQSFRKVKYQTDTFRFNGETIPIERIKNQELSKFLVKGGDEYKVAMALMKLQEQLESMKSYVLQHKDINYIKVGEEHLADIRSANTDFDYSNYQKEYDFYVRYKDPKYVTYDATAKRDYAKLLNALVPIDLEIDSAVRTLSKFHIMLLEGLPEYKAILIDTVSVKGVLEYRYRNGEEDELSFYYSYHSVGGNADLKVQGRTVVTEQIISGQFLTMLKIYNKLFGLNISPEEAQQHGEYNGVVVYNGTMYIHFFHHSSVKKGYWEILLKQR